MSPAGDPPANPTYAAAFKDELPRLIPTLKAFLHKFGITSRYAEDLVQDVVLAVWQAIVNDAFRPEPGMRLGESLSRYAFGVAAHRAIDLKRSAAYRKEHSSLVTSAEDEIIEAAIDPSSLRDEERIEARDILRRVEQLRPEHREVLAMVGEGEKTKAIESKVESMVRRRLRGAREALAGTMDPGARRSVWKDAPKITIKRQRSRHHRDPEDENPEHDFWPCGFFC